MKKLALALSSLSLLVLSANTNAASNPSTDIKVIGEIIAPTCQITAPSGGVYDYGSISHTLVNANSATSLGVNMQSDKWTVICDSETPLSINVIDNRAGTASLSGVKNFGLGSINGTGKLGYYTIRMIDASGDSRMLSPYIGSVASNALGYAELQPGKRLGFSESNVSKPAIAKSFQFRLLIEAFLAKKSDLHGGISESTKLDGSTTLEFGFGV